ncbi:MAG: hypothetical protein KGH63_03745, partial [Candidatus Micrarchaeota archaeon]|nr:hypothetical protein [Candidatus Micrarchaeota archaeon]
MREGYLVPMFVFQVQFRRGKPGETAPEPKSPEPQEAPARKERGFTAPDSSLAGAGAIRLQEFTPSKVRQSLDSWMGEQKTQESVRALVDRMVSVHFGDESTLDLIRARQSEAAHFYSDPSNAPVAALAEKSISDWAAKLLP